jgi:hypothetical protein
MQKYHLAILLQTRVHVTNIFIHTYRHSKKIVSGLNFYKLIQRKSYKLQVQKSGPKIVQWRKAFHNITLIDMAARIFFQQLGVAKFGRF